MTANPPPIFPKSLLCEWRNIDTELNVLNSHKAALEKRRGQIIDQLCALRPDLALSNIVAELLALDLEKEADGSNGRIH